MSKWTRTFLNKDVVGKMLQSSGKFLRILGNPKESNSILWENNVIQQRTRLLRVVAGIRVYRNAPETGISRH